MKRFLLLLLLAANAFAGEGDEYRIDKLAEGVYGLVFLEEPIHHEPNVLIIVNEKDVVVVDSSMFPSTARMIIAEIRKLTPNPVRFLINTHWHDDHIFGNAVYRQAFPGVEIIAHETTGPDAMAKGFGQISSSLANTDNQSQYFRTLQKRGTRDDGSALDEKAKKRVARLVDYFDTYAREIKTVAPEFPEVTFERSLTLRCGSRTIELHHLGRGNTRGDVVVWLPKEKILATGDLVVSPTPFGFGSYYREWIDTLERLTKFDAATIFLSHGKTQRDFAYVATLRDLLRALVDQVAEQVAKGASLEDVKKTVTLADWRTKLAGEDKMAASAFDSFFVTPAVERAYRQAKGEPDEMDGIVANPR